jgi:hypothetical protein
MATKPRFSLTLSPTFKAKVSIPVPGEKSADVEFIFKGRSREQFKDFIDSLKDREDTDMLMDIASGWELEDAFTKENVEILTGNYLGAAKAVIDCYVAELTTGRSKN